MDYNRDNLIQSLSDASAEFRTSWLNWVNAKVFLKKKLKDHMAEFRKIRSNISTEAGIQMLLELDDKEIEKNFEIYEKEEYRLADRDFEITREIINFIKHEDRKEMELTR